MTRRIATICALSLTTLALAGCDFAQRAQDNAESVGEASSVNCVHERQTFQLAMESYLLLENRTVAVEAEMVPNYLRAQSPLWDIDAAGNIVPQPGGGCE